MSIHHVWLTIQNNFFLPCFFLCLLTACGLEKAKYIVYPQPENKEQKSDEPCPIGLSAFTFHIAPMLALRCTKGCHTLGGNAGEILLFTGDATKDSTALQDKEDGSALGLFRKARGLVPHRGGVAAEAEDEQRFKLWLAAENLCNLDNSMQ